MARIKIELPQSFRFSCYIPVRITDVNYGGHVGNDAILSIIHEARMQFFKSLDYSEMNFAGTAMIMVDVCIEFKGELFYGDTLIASVAAGGFANTRFDVFYLMEKEVNGRRTKVVIARTGMACYDYERKKIVAIPDEARQKLNLC